MNLNYILKCMKYFIGLYIVGIYGKEVWRMVNLDIFQCFSFNFVYCDKIGGNFKIV